MGDVICVSLFWFLQWFWCQRARKPGKNQNKLTHMTSPIRWVDAETRSLRSTDYVRDVTWGGGVWGLPDYGLPVGSDVQEHTTEDRRDGISALDIPTVLARPFRRFSIDAKPPKR